MEPGDVTIRPIARDDRNALRDAFDRLSPESRYRRFLVAKPELSERDLDYLTQVDHSDHEALVATDETGAIVGVARFVRIARDEAEPAIVVADDWQGHGIGTRLLDALVTRAREEGVTQFRAQVLATNDEAISLMSRLGPIERTPYGTEIELAIALAPEQQARDRLLSMLRRAAAGTVVPALTLLHRLAWRAPRTPLERDAFRNAVVVAADGSPSSRETALAAASLAATMAAAIELVALRDDGDLEALADELRQRGVQVRTHVRRGALVPSLVDVAAEQQARLIVVDASERSAAARLLVGDMPYAVARNAPCDVLLLRR